MLMVEMNKVQRPSIIYEDNQGAIFLAKNMHVGIRRKILIFIIIFFRTCCKTKILISNILVVKITLCTS